MRKAQAANVLLCVLASSIWITRAEQLKPGASRDAIQSYLNRTADAVLALKSTRFSLKREGTPAVLDEKNGITFTAADCVYSAPDRVSCNVKVSLKNGTILQLTRVWVPEGTFQSNPLTRQFGKAPADANFNGVVLFARDRHPGDSEDLGAEGASRRPRDDREPADASSARRGQRRETESARRIHAQSRSDVSRRFLGRREVGERRRKSMSPSPRATAGSSNSSARMNRSTFRRRSCRPPPPSRKPECRAHGSTRADPRARLPPRLHRRARSHHRLRRAAGSDPLVDDRDPEARRRRMGRHRLLRLVCDQHDVHGQGVRYRRPPPRVSALSRDFLRRVMAGRGLAGVAHRHRAESDATVPGPSACRFRFALRADCRPCHSGIRRRSDGAGEHGPGRRPVSARETGAAARHHRGGRYGGLGIGTSLRRHHGAVHELAVPVLDQSPCRLRDLLHHVVGIDRPATDGREGRHRLDRRDASWRGADPAQCRPWRAGSRARRINRSSIATSSVLGRRGGGGVRRVPGSLSGACAIPYSTCASSRTAICRQRAASICSSASASWSRLSAFPSSSTLRARQTR